jgi:hypothetical protein
MCPIPDCSLSDVNQVMFGRRGTLERHLQHDHQIEANLRCPFCGFESDITCFKHIAHHMEEIAFGALTTAYEQWSYNDSNSSEASIPLISTLEQENEDVNEGEDEKLDLGLSDKNQNESNAQDDVSSDKGFQTDDEEGFAVSDDDSDAGSDHDRWSPGLHKRVSWYNCDQCDNGFDRADKFRDHFQDTHAIELPNRLPSSVRFSGTAIECLYDSGWQVWQTIPVATCKICAKTKSHCKYGKPPCSRCTRVGAKCSYPAARIQRIDKLEILEQGEDKILQQDEDNLWTRRSHPSSSASSINSQRRYKVSDDFDVVGLRNELSQLRHNIPDDHESPVFDEEHPPVVSQIPSMAMSTVVDEENSRGRWVGRWWESDRGSSGSIENEKSGSMKMETSLAAESLSLEQGGSPAPDSESNEKLQSTDEGWGQEEQVQRLLKIIEDQSKLVQSYSQAEDNYWTRRSHPASSASSINSQLRSSVSGLKKQPEKNGKRPEPFNEEEIQLEAETQNLKRENQMLEGRIKALGMSRHIQGSPSCWVCSIASTG